MPDQQIDALYRTRPRSRFVRASLVVALALLVGSWFAVDASLGDLFRPQHLERFETFLSEDVRPAPVRETAWDWGTVGAWADDLMDARGWDALVATLAISVLAIVIAWGLALVVAPAASRSIATPEPYLREGQPPSTAVRSGWRALVAGTRLALIVMRSLPEYMLAFFLVAILGEHAWAVVLALTIHNTGILGRLDAEVIENLPATTLRALRSTGASRTQILTVGVLPAAFNRFLLYFFYRWETCVREATILGTLGVVSLGYWIDDARHRGQEDTMVFFVLLGAALIIVGDAVSALARWLVRRAS